MLQPPVSFKDIVDRYSLTCLAGKPLDLVFDESEGLTSSRGRGILLGSTAHNAMWVLVSTWRLNVPAMRLLFDAASELRAQESEHEESEEAVLADVWPDGERPKPEGLAALQAVQDISGSAVLGRGALSGSVMIMAAALLNDFRANLRPNSKEWPVVLEDGSRPTVAQVIIAAANSFRHYDEWRADIAQNKVTKRQQQSIDILLAALGTNTPQAFLEKINASEQVSLLLAGGDFDVFEDTVLKYANDVAERVAART